MITIQKAQANNIVFTLYELTSISNAVYLLELHNNQDHSQKVVVLGTNLSANVSRYDEFLITEDDSEDLANAIVSLDRGDYDYFVWQSPNSDYANRVSIVESGKCKVIGEGEETFTFTQRQTEYTLPDEE